MSSSPSSSSSRPVVEASAPAHAAFRDVPVMVEVLLGTGSMPLGQLVALQPGVVVRLDQAAGSDLVVSATGVSLAVSEVVIIEDSVASRVTHLLTPSGDVAA